MADSGPQDINGGHGIDAGGQRRPPPGDPEGVLGKQSLPYGPAGGVPETVRMDRGKDFLSAAVTTALGAMGVTVNDLPAYSPHLKEVVESLNRAADRMLFAALPGYTTGPRSERQGRTAGAVSVLSSRTSPRRSWRGRTGGTPRTARKPCRAVGPYAAGGVAGRSDSCHRPRRRPVGLHPRGRGPAPEADQSWRELARPHLHRRVDDRPAGRQVRVRHTPHHDHDHEIEFCDARGRHLGPAHLADAATAEQLQALREARAERARRLRADAKATERLRRQRFAPHHLCGTRPAAGSRHGSPGRA